MLRVVPGLLCAMLVFVGVAFPSSARAQIAGGFPIDIKEVPWQVALRIRSGDRSALCGGSVVDRHWVLTAAHCLPAGVRASDVQVITGTSDYLNGGRWIGLSRVVVHERYDPATHAADLALLRLLAPIEGAAVALAAPDSTLSPGQPLLVSGWGATAEGGAKSRQLMGALVPYVDNETCNAPASYAGRVQPGMLCAGEVFGGPDACQGDSGGPLVKHNPAGAILVGVVSFGVGCGRTAKYGVYVRVSTFRDWIERNLQSR